MNTKPTRKRNLPSVDAMLRRPALLEAMEAHGRTSVLAAVRVSLETMRQAMETGGPAPSDRESALLAVETGALAWLEKRAGPTLRRVFNLTGTVLHTNLGRAPLAPQAVEAMVEASSACNVEYELQNGGRGERDDHVSRRLVDLTGADDALAVNNNAAAVLLALNSLAPGREVIVSRGELIEIGGSFRIPDIMARAGSRLVEVGTTNRTHPSDYINAIGPETAAIMRVHPSNYAIEGFTSSVPEPELAQIAQRHGLPFIVDLGSGTLTDLTRFGLPPEPTPQQVLNNGADLVTFSGDKLLGGPQAGLVVGKGELVKRLRQNPMKRALRLDKILLAALSATLRLYEHPERLPQTLPTLRILAREEQDIRNMAERISRPVGLALASTATVTIEPCLSQIGSGSLPVDRLASWSLTIRTGDSGKKLEWLARAFRSLPVPVIGRLQHSALILDLRCLEDEHGFVSQLDHLEVTDSR